VADLRQRQAEPTRLADEGEETEDVSGIPTIAGRRARGRRQDAARLIQSQRLAGQPAARCNVPDEQPRLHDRRIGPVPWVKVKGLMIEARTRQRRKRRAMVTLS